MFADSLNILHVLWFFVAGHQQIDQVEKGEDDESYMEDVLLVENRVELQIVYLQTKYHVYFSVVGVCRKRADTELNNSNRSYQHKNNVE